MWDKKEKNEETRNILNYSEKRRKIRKNSSKEYITKNGEVITGKVFNIKNSLCPKKRLSSQISEVRKTTVSALLEFQRHSKV